MSDLVPSAPRGFQAENAEHAAAKEPGTTSPPECFQAEEGEHSPPAPEERGPDIA